jgi:putative transposase
MPRIGRIAPGGLVYHVLNRGNGRRRLFYKDADYAAFLKLLGEAIDRVPTRVLGYCLMPNHWHLVLWPREDGELSLFMRWLSNTHVRRYHQHYHTYGQGHVYQGRFKSFPVQDDRHLLTVLRYVEANPLRAKLVTRAEAWEWSSLSRRQSPSKKWNLLTDGPLDRPRNWPKLVNEVLRRADLETVRTSAARGRPYGDDQWAMDMARRMGLRPTLNERGRPRKIGKS